MLEYSFLPNIRTLFLIADTVVSDDDNGIFVNPSQPGSAQGTLDHVLASNNRLSGICTCSFFKTSGAANVAGIKSIASNSINGVGFDVNNGFLQLAHSTAIQNHIGVRVLGNGTAISFGDNHINENDTNVSATLTNVGTH